MKLKELIVELVNIQNERGGDIEVEARNPAGDRQNADNVYVLEQGQNECVVIE